MCHAVNRRSRGRSRSADLRARNRGYGACNGARGGGSKEMRRLAIVAVASGFLVGCPDGGGGSTSDEPAADDSAPPITDEPGSGSAADTPITPLPATTFLFERRVRKDAS